VLDVIADRPLIDNTERQFRWSKRDERRLNDLNETCKSLQQRDDWTWNAADDTEQGLYNDAMMQFCITEKCRWRLTECPDCGSCGILVGKQTDSEVCYDCLKQAQFQQKKQKRQEAWD